MIKNLNNSEQKNFDKEFKNRNPELVKILK
jgi:hypothetical protein